MGEENALIVTSHRHVDHAVDNAWLRRHWVSPLVQDHVVHIPVIMNDKKVPFATSVLLFNLSFYSSFYALIL